MCGLLTRFSTSVKLQSAAIDQEFPEIQELIGQQRSKKRCQNGAPNGYTNNS
jgi:hypothetical protein